MLAWGLRMAIAIIVPLFLGNYYQQTEAAMWVIITAESIGWVELKGSFAQRIRVLLGGAFLAVLFGALGSISGTSLLLSMLLMAFVVFVAILFKNLGERGSSLSLTVYVMFIIANAYPTPWGTPLEERCIYIGIGGLWCVLVGAVATLFIREQTPYKRSVAMIWKKTADLALEPDKGWNGIAPKASLRNIYLKDKAIQDAIESSLQLFEKRAYQKNHENENALELAQLRKCVYLIGATLMNLSEELDQLSISNQKANNKQSIHALIKSISIICERMTLYTVSNKKEELLLLQSRIMRLQNMVAILREAAFENHEKNIIARITHLTERIIKLCETSLLHIQQSSKDEKVYQSYSLMKTLLIIHHKHWLRNLKDLMHLNNHSFRYAVRSVIIALCSLFIYKAYHIAYGYWLPFTVMIILQPYFGATLKKALDRVLGTVLGVSIGGLLMMLPEAYHLKEILLISSSILMVYFLRYNYSIATFFISLFLVALFANDHSLDQQVIYARIFCTLGGAALAVIGEFALLPAWEKKYLPEYFYKMAEANFNYFIYSFYNHNEFNTAQWTHYRREAEVANSNAFESFNRLIKEPKYKNKNTTLSYQLIAHSIRICKALNNYHLDNDPHKKDIITEDQALLSNVERIKHKYLEICSRLWQVAYKQKAFKDFSTAASICIIDGDKELLIASIAKLEIELDALNRDLIKWELDFSESGRP